MINLLLALLIPRHASCLSNEAVNGIRPSGVYECRHIPPRDPVGSWPERNGILPPYEGKEREGVIHCRRGSVPIVTGPRSVGCL